MDEVTTDDLRLLMVPLSKGSSGMYGQLNMLIKNIFNSAEESKVIKEMLPYQNSSRSLIRHLPHRSALGG